MTKRSGPPVNAAAEWVDIRSLVPWERNPVIHTDAEIEELRALVASSVWTDPLVARRSDLRIIAGHRRRLAALSALEKDPAWTLPDAPSVGFVPVRFVEVDDATAARLTIADNAMTKQSEWDDGELVRMLGEIEDPSGLGFDDDELAAMLAEPKAAPEATDDIPEVQAEVHSKVGEVYELGPHRLWCGDRRDAETVARLLGGRKINIAFTSPPYASQRTYDETSGFKPIPPDEFSTWFEAVQANVRAHLAPDGPWFVNIKEHSSDGQRSLYAKDLTVDHVRRWGWRFVDELCWRHNGLPGYWPDRFKNQFEPIFHFSASAPKFRPDNVTFSSEHSFGYEPGREPVSTGNVGFKSAKKSQGMALPGNVIEPGKSRESLGHAAAFPVALPSFFVKAFTDKADTVYDPFMGSGTTMMAAAQTGRAAFGCEISPRYCDVIRRRWTRYAKEAGIDAGSGALDG